MVSLLVITTAPIRVKVLIVYVGHIGVMATFVEVRPSRLGIQLIGLRWRRINSVSSYTLLIVPQHSPHNPLNAQVTK